MRNTEQKINKNNCALEIKHSCVDGNITVSMGRITIDAETFRTLDRAADAAYKHIIANKPNTWIDVEPYLIAVQQVAESHVAEHYCETWRTTNPHTTRALCEFVADWILYGYLDTDNNLCEIAIAPINPNLLPTESS